jgi:hypothetical protein
LPAFANVCGVGRDNGVVWCVIALLGCGAEPREESGASMASGAMATDGDDAGVDASTGAPSDSGAVDDSEAEGGVLLDVAPGPGNEGGDGTTDECTNVDILFVIDNSGSMSDNQDQLIASFPGFVAGMQDALEFAESYHIGVTTTSNYTNNGPDCWRYGDLVTQTVGAPLSSNAVCGPFTSGSSYIDETEPDLAGKFQCIAKVGGGGDSEEMPIRSLLDALKPGTNAPGACNDGFSRLDSLLVIVIISDEDDVYEECGPGEFPCFPTGTEGTPQEWHDEVLTYKANLPENVVVLSIIARQLDNPCGAVPAARLMSFTNDFGANGHIGDVCAASYEEVFTAVLPVIDEACENYVEPEG